LVSSTSEIILLNPENQEGLGDEKDKQLIDQNKSGSLGFLFLFSLMLWIVFKGSKSLIPLPTIFSTKV
jgi:hypothetical protein